jgi:hypothetical protein
MIRIDGWLALTAFFLALCTGFAWLGHYLRIGVS